MAKKKKEKPYRWIQNGMLLQRDITPWSPGYLIGEGKADALWRTGYGAVAYNGTEKGDIFIEGIKSCFKDDGEGGIHAWRYPVDEDNGTFSGLPSNLKFDSVSRDQTMMGFVGLAANGRQDLVKKYHSGLKWKLSYFNDQTIDYWLWAKAVGGNWFWVQMFWLLSAILIPVSIGWNAFIFWIGKINRKRNFNDPVDGYGHVPLDFTDNAGYDWEWNKLDDYIYKAQWPFYVYVQFCLQMYVLPKHPLKSLLQWVCKAARFKDNYFVRLLLGEEVSQEEIDSYKPRYGSRWGSRMNITSRSSAKLLKPEHYTDLNYDKDILEGLKRINTK
jgi:hypothetical protein